MALAWAGPAASQSLELGRGLQLQSRGGVFAEGWFFPGDPLDPRQPDFIASLGGTQDAILTTPYHLDMRANGRIHFDPQERRRNRLAMDDLYLDYHREAFEARAGYQIVSWKVVESVSRADILNQDDWELDFMDPQKLGELSARVRLKSTGESNQMLEFYYLPSFRRAMLPRTGNRYDFFAGAQGVEFDPDAAQYDSRWRAWRPQGAIRYAANLFEKLDLSLFYFNGYRRFPTLAAEPSSPPGRIVFRTRYTPVNVAGATFQSVLGNWLWKGEAAYSSFENEVLSPLGTRVAPYLAYTLGFEYTFYSLLAADQDLGAILELTGDTDAGKGTARLEGYRPFRSDAFMALRYAFNGTANQSLIVGTLVDYLQGDLLVQGEFSRKVTDNLALKLQFASFALVKSDEMQPFRRSSRLAAKAAYNW